LKKTNPENVWYKDNESAVNEAVDAYIAEHNLGSNSVGTFRKVLCAEWKKQDQSVVKYYQGQAAEQKGLAEAAGPLQGEDRLKYVVSLIVI
jgi:hypothetical protein